MNVNAYAAKAAIMIGMIVAGRVIAKLLMKALAHVGVVQASCSCRRQVPSVDGGEDRPPARGVGGVGVRNEVTKMPIIGTIHRKQIT